MSETALETTGLSKRYRRRWALEDCTFSIPRGHVVGLVGPNGAGKSTLLNLAAGLLAPTSGSIEVLGECPARDRRPARAGSASSPRTPRSTPRSASRTTSASGRTATPGGTATRRTARLAELGLGPRQRAGKLSGGQRAQLSLTIALAKRPELLLLDEPVASLDPLARREFLGLLMATVEGQRREHRALVAPRQRHRAGLRLPDRARGLPGARRRRDRGAARRPPPARRPGTAGDAAPANQTVVASSSVGPPQRVLVVRSDGPVVEPGWEIETLSLEDLVLAYMGQGTQPGGATTSTEMAP